MGSAVEVASLFATLSLQDQMSGGLREAERGISRFSRNMDRVGQRMTAIGSAGQQALSPVLGFFQDGIGVAADFESVMNEVAARTGLTGDEMERVSELALEMGADTAFSAQQAADAFLQLLSSGQSLEDAMSTLPTVLAGAAASGMDLGTMADSVTDIMAMFGLEVEDLPEDIQEVATAMGITREEMESWAKGYAPELDVQMAQLAGTFGMTADSLKAIIAQEDAADVVESLVKAAGSSSATVQDLNDALINVGTSAALFGINANDTIAALAVLAESGFKGAEAGTKLNSLLTQMSSPAAAEAWRELGVSLYNAEGDVRDFNDVLLDLDAAFEDLPMDDQIRLSQELGGSYGRGALLALLNANGIGDMREAMDKAASVADVAAARMSGWEGANDALGGSLETLQIEVLGPLLENVLTPMVQKLTEIVNSVVEWAKENPGLSQGLALVILASGALFGIMVPLGVIISAVGTAVGGLATALGLARTAALAVPVGMWLVVAPIIAIGAAIAAVIAKVHEFNMIVGGGAAAAGQAYVESGVDQLQLDWAAFQSSDGQGLLAGIGAAPHFAASTSGAAGIEYDWSQGWANYEAFRSGQTIDDLRGPLTTQDGADVLAPTWVPGRALGGNVSAGNPYIVGEDGPELYVPRNSGSIIPNRALSGGGVTINLTAYGTHPYELVEMIERAARDIR